MTRRWKLQVDAVLLVATLVASLSGIVLLAAFHVPGGWYRTESFGLSRLAWLDLHRSSAAATLISALAHVIGNLAPLGSRLLRAAQARVTRQDLWELVLYVIVPLAWLSGFGAWLLIEGSAPLAGPLVPGPLPAERHCWIDLHFLTAFISFVPLTIHVRRRWKVLLTLARRSGEGAQQRESNLRIPLLARHRTRYVTVETRSCKACGRCVKACRKGILRIVGIGPHQHVAIRGAKECEGCLECIRACKHGAICP